MHDFEIFGAVNLLLLFGGRGGGGILAGIFHLYRKA